VKVESIDIAIMTICGVMLVCTGIIVLEVAHDVVPSIILLIGGLVCIGGDKILDWSYGKEWREKEA